MIVSFDPATEAGDVAVMVTGFPTAHGFHIIDVKEGEKALQAMRYLQRPRLRFNHGYWDGMALTARGAARQDGLIEENILALHPDPFYAYGCLAGAAAVRGEGPRGITSDPAWNDFLAGLTDPDLIFQIEANP